MVYAFPFVFTWIQATKMTPMAPLGALVDKVWKTRKAVQNSKNLS